MASTIAWLDVSVEEQKRARELISLFIQPESRDELGIGQLRDAFSDALFPGTSVLQTRARYFLIVPWLYALGQRRGRSGDRLNEWVDNRERRLIEAMRKAKDDEDIDGLIGKVAGAAVKTLPSTIYWNGMREYKILRQDVAGDQLSRNDLRRVLHEAEELVARDTGDWHGSIPNPPEGFPDELRGGFTMRRAEAVWLAERIALTTPGSLLAHLVQGSARTINNSRGPWDDPACLTTVGTTRDMIKHAELFSLCMQGASLLYNLLVAERYEGQGLTRIEGKSEEFRERLVNWAHDCDAATVDLRLWDRRAMWRILMAEGGSRAATATREFVSTWLEAVVDRRFDGAADDIDLRRIVTSRERRRGSQSRLRNDRLLQMWSGASGAGRLAFRWPNVRSIVRDIHAGIDRESE
ncbi:DUF6361 family protein [Propionibacteriaceae bacterium Y2011]